MTAREIGFAHGQSLLMVKWPDLTPEASESPLARREVEGVGGGATMQSGWPRASEALSGALARLFSPPLSSVWLFMILRRRLRWTAGAIRRFRPCLREGERLALSGLVGMPAAG